jgi:hypothetical protein
MNRNDFPKHETLGRAMASIGGNIPEPRGESGVFTKKSVKSQKFRESTS